MTKRKIKSKRKYDDDDDYGDDDEIEIPRTIITIGEISVSARCGLPQMKRFTKSLLEDKKINSYLSNFQKKKLFSTLSYVD